ncbi:transposase, partial [Mitsuokella jalaludinii]|uniref:transposase n=2 Tax=Mitsuokella jalaludinii TaxID=187979 RepID=UPI003AF941A1
LGSGYCDGQARKGMPRHIGGPEEPVLAWWKKHEQDRCCRQPPHHPWERGTNENTNGLLQEFFPKGKDITDTPEDYIQRKYHELNLRPRKCLGYKTPYEVYFSKVLHLA